MKPIYFIALLAATLLAISCGLSEKEKTALLQSQKAKDDSARLAQIEQVKNEEALRTALSDSISNYNALLLRQQNTLIQLRAAIYTANDQMIQIKGFHFGRLPQEREAQIHNQEVTIQTLLLQQTNLQTAIERTTTAISQFKSELAMSR